ncbi:hypothetical protein BG005_000427 [Podila minutissima]|nr:hypothetical protein BG005_000427 [Podila minutissima]
MVSFKLALATILAPLLLANSVSAGAAICVGWKHKSWGTIALGFHVWGFDGQQIATHKTVNDGYFHLTEDGWHIWPEIIVTPHGQDHIKSLHVQYFGGPTTPGFKRVVEWPEKLCTYYHEHGLSRGIYLSCHENGDKGYCSKNYKALSKKCSEYLDLGPDSVSCKPINSTKILGHDYFESA